MADIEVRRPHDLGLAAARRAAEQMASDLARKFDVHASWQGDTLRFERPGVSGFVTLTQSDLHLSISLGFLLKAMQASIEKLVLQELDTLFAAHPRAKEPAPRHPPASRAPTAKKAAKRPKKCG
jgi:putative polyhydroxyalkanoate system protein